MIKSLTKEQENLLSVYRDKWMKIGLDTTPANRMLAEDALNRAYKISGLNAPKQIGAGVMSRFFIWIKDGC